MGFLDRLLGREEKEPVLVELRVEEVEPFLEKKAEEKKEIMERVIPSKFSEIRHLINETNRQLDMLEKTEVSEEGNKRLRKAVRTAKRDIIKRINSLLKKIQPPLTTDAQRIRSYCYESLELIQEKIRSSGKSLAYASIVLRDAMREIGKRLHLIERAFKSLIQTIRENTILFEKNRLLSIASDIRSMERELIKTEKEVGELKESLEAIETEKNSMEGVLARLLDSEESRELKQLEDRRKKILEERGSLRNQLINTVAGVNRPLKKLENMVKRGEHFLGKESDRALKLFLENPPGFFSFDPKGESFKLLLSELRSLIVQNKLDLKEKEREKKLREIDMLLKLDFFSSFFWRENDLERELKEIEKKEKTTKIKEEIDAIERSLSGINQRHSETLSSIKERDGKKQELRKKIRKAMDSLSSTLSELTGEKIKIVSTEEAKNIKAIETEKSGVKTN